jgi:hypothetical protein
VFVITTIYWTDLHTAEQPATQKPDEESVLDPDKVGRELVGIYQGQNRSLPKDRER